MTEEQVTQTILDVAKKIAHKFKFGSFEEEDLINEAFILSVEGLEKYDESRPLPNFLYVHIKNRLGNLKRKKYARIELPCVHCPLKAYLPPNGCSAYEDRLLCEIFARWHHRNEAKKKLADNVCAEDYNKNTRSKDKLDSDEAAIVKSVAEKIDRRLGPDDRKSYLMFLHNCKMPQAEKDRIVNVIRSISNE